MWFNIQSVYRLGSWCLMPLSTIFQLYRSFIKHLDFNNGKGTLIVPGSPRQSNTPLVRHPLCTRTTRFKLDFYSANSLKQQSVDKHVAPLGHIILTPSQPVFVLSPSCCVLNGEATNYNYIQSWFDSIGARTHDLSHSRRAR